MKTKILLPLALLLGSLAPASLAQTTPPVLTVSITQIGISDGTINANPGLLFTSFGSGYTANPTVTFTGGGGSGVAATAVETNGTVTSVTINPVGSGYIGAPSVVFSGGQASGQTAPSQAVAVATLNFPASSTFNAPFQNEVFGASGRTIEFSALAQGTQPASFVYTFTVNGLGVGSSPAEPPGTPGQQVWTPPQPGVYAIVATTSDPFGNTATSAAIRYFAIGTILVSPEASSYPPGNTGQNSAGPGSLIPVGSSIVIEATSQPGDGFVSRIDFYTDWNGTSGTLISSSKSYPYSVIYTPAGPVGTTHVVKALAYDNTGTLVPDGTPGGPYKDQLNLTMTTPNSSQLPTCSIFTPANNTQIPIPDYAANASASIPVEVLAAPGSNGPLISKVELYINGVLFGTQTGYPYNFSWQPTVTGAYDLTALAYDNLGNVIASTTGTGVSQTPAPTVIAVEATPGVAITSPASGATLNSGAPTSITATAVDTNLNLNGTPATIQQVQFFQDGTFVGVATAPTAGSTDSYTVSFAPVQKLESGIAVPSTLTAIATDTLGYSEVSEGIQVNVTTGGTGGNVILGVPPTISLLTPVSQQDVVVNTPTTLSATAAAPNGNIASIQFLVDNKPLTTVTQYPYTAQWTPQNLGFYTVTATVTDNLGDKVSSQTITVNVVPEPPPIVTITSPTTGSIVPVGSSVTVTATANSPNGTIQSVQFYQNGISIGTSSAQPYSASFSPSSTGVYSITAIATDNTTNTTTSTPVLFLVTPASNGLGTVEYFGFYQGLTDAGIFAFGVVDGTTGTFIAQSTTSAASSTKYYPDLAVNSAGSFSAAAVNKVVPVSGTGSVIGVNGSLLPGNDTYIGSIATAGSVAVNSGVYSGSFIGQSASVFTGIVGADGEIMVYVSNGSFADSGYTNAIDSSGNFTITTANNNTITGTVSPTTGFLTAKLAGGPGGNVLAGKVSGGTFSDGILSNLSTRGQIGTGANIMIGGFVVGGTVPKQLLIRADGPALTALGVSGAIAATQLNVYGTASSTVPVASNVGWSSTTTNATQVGAAELSTGAFTLLAGSSDSALVSSFAPGAYTAQVSGVGADTGVGLVEIYDMSVPSPFTSNKLTNVSTRLSIGTGSAVGIVGFNITGSAPKRLLIRGAGPGLTALGVTGALPTPHLQLMNQAGSLIRENYSWSSGNDPALLSAAEAATGAFTYTAGSADSAILMVLPPGTYTAELSGTNSATGVGLVEVYEVP
jgi:hypothetical protein